MARKLKSDRILFQTTLALVCLSVLMVYSAAAADNPYNYLIKQVMWAVLGFTLLSVVMRIDYRSYREPAFIWTAVGSVTLALVAVLFMPEHNNASRWFGFGGLGIQPSEPAKLAAIVFIAALLERRMHRVNELNYALLPIAVVVLVWIGLILWEPDLGTSVAIALITFVMVFAAGLNYGYIAGVVLAAIPAVAFLVMSAGYRKRRFLAFLNPWQDPLGDGYQIIQSLIAVATGGFTGRGLMDGVQKLRYLPEAQTDFIYAVIAEELGMIGATLILVCFCVIAWRGLRISLEAPDKFGAFLALGLTTMVVVQAFVNMSVVLGLFPTKGIPLPFVSFGGSSLLVNLVGMGVLLNISQHATPSEA
ncbi:MAG TPA: putative lipid II flippase FtsW [Vicinamibacterales bacterium]|jgi:cell division protein FtsW|nr:putative lipid II flippase FtsW [Vicinamibacterales bacterium]